MKKLLRFIPLIFAAILLITGSAYGVSFQSLEAGTEITINDTIPDSTYDYHASGPSQSLGTAGEDNETESLGSINSYTGNWWDFEAMYYNPSKDTLTIFAGFDLSDPYSTHQVGDLFLGSWGNNDPLGNSYSPRYAFDLDISTNSYTVYDIYDDAGNAPSPGVVLQEVTDVVPYSNPYRLADSGGQAGVLYGGLDSGRVDDASFKSWGKYASDPAYPSNEHYYLQILGLNNFFGANLNADILHITLDCGNDTLRGMPVGSSTSGSQVPVPEPATLLLLGSGLIGIAGFGRIKFGKK